MIEVKGVSDRRWWGQGGVVGVVGSMDGRALGWGW